MIRVTVVLRGKTGADELRERLTGPQWQAFCREIADDMGMQARRNIIEHGGPGGDWAPLDGFNRRKEARKEAKAIKSGFKAAAVGLDAIDAARRREIERAAASKGQHSGYAQRKEEGKTPGHGKHGADERLRDTDALFNALTGVPRFEPGRTIIELRAPGHNSRGVELEKILGALALGTVHIPARNPAAHMEQFEKRFARLLQSYLDKRKP